MSESVMGEQQIFSAALELAPERRSAYLQGACLGDSVLIGKIQRMLDEHDSARRTADLAAGATAGAAPTLLRPVGEQIGQNIGPYKLLQELGEGGFGTVYLAEQEVPVHRRVALKVIKLGMDTRQVVARFEAERQALAMMDHPNIAKVLDAGATDLGRPFFVMELVRGVPITAYCDQNNLSIPMRLELFTHVCSAIQHAHQKGIIHRDIKPSNILVTVHDGVPVPKVIDFGVAKATDQRLTEKTLVTAIQQLIGTPAYMSPEQAEMSGLDIDTRADIYSLGAVLYELLAGRTPFDAKTLMSAGVDGMRHALRETPPTRPSTRLGTMSEKERLEIARHRECELPRLLTLLRGDLDWIVMKTLEKDRTRRYETANLLRQDIINYLEGRPVIARPPSVTYRTRKFVARHKFAVMSASLIAVALLLGLVTASWQAVRATRAEREQFRLRRIAEQATIDQEIQKQAAEEARNEESILRHEAQEQELKARRRAYASDMNLIQQALAESDLGRAEELLYRQRPGPGQIDLRGWEWRYLWQFCRSDALFSFKPLEHEITSMSLSPDGKYLAVAQANAGDTVVIDLANRTEVARLPAGTVTGRVAVSPTEPLIAYSEGGFNTPYQLTLYNFATSTKVNSIPLRNCALGISFSADGKTIAVFTLNRGLIMLQTSSLEKTASISLDDLSNEYLYLVGVAVNHEMSAAAYAQNDGNVRVLDLPSGTERCVIPAAHQRVMALAFSPDDSTLASAAGFTDSDIHLWDARTGKAKGVLSGHSGWVSSLVFWPDGKKLASTSADQTIKIWDLATGNCINTLRGNHQEVWSAALLPDNRTLVSGAKDGVISLWDSTRVNVSRPYATCKVPRDFWTFGKDGTSVVSLDGLDVIQWPGPDYSQRKVLMTLHPRIPIGLPLGSFSGDRRWLATAMVIYTQSIIGRYIQVWDLDRAVQDREIELPISGIPFGTYDNGQKLVLFQSNRKIALQSGAQTKTNEILDWPNDVQNVAVAMSADSSRIVMSDWLGHLATVSLKDETGHVGKADVQEVSGIALSPDGKILAVPSGLGSVQLLDAQSLKPIGMINGFLRGAHSASFSTDDSRLAVGSNGKEAVTLWDVESEQRVLALEAPGSSFTDTSFSPDGSTLAADNSEETLYLWKAPSWEEIAAADKSSGRTP